MPWRGPDRPGDFPTLGYLVLDWVTEHLIVPDGPRAGEPLVFTDDQARFVLRFYRIDPHTGKRAVRRGVFSRPKGSGKSPVLAALSICEALGPVVPDGWDAEGEPVGTPWASLGFKPKVQIVAVSEDQTANTWDPLLEMCREGPVGEMYDIEPLDTFVNVPRGRIEYVTSSATSREGFRPVFAVMDQTESWTQTNGGHRLAAAIRRNLTKTGGSSVETPNAFRPGMESVAEKSYEAWQLQVEGKLKGDDGILFDHREAPPETDITDRESLLAGLAYAYGDSADVNGGWVDLHRVLYDFWDPSTEPADARMYFLNQITATEDAWLSQPEWSARTRLDVNVGPDEPITVGFDGSKKRRRGVADATALVGCRVSDGHVFLIECWEQPDPHREWEVPAVEVDAEVRRTFDRFNVVGFYCDPARWESYVAQWEAAYGPQMRVKATGAHPLEWWMTGGRAATVERALERFETAVTAGEMTHDGSSVLMRHVLNARRRLKAGRLMIAKEHPDSPRKIDAAVAAVLAYQARLDAVAAGVLADTAKSKRLIRR